VSHYPFCIWGILYEGQPGRLYARVRSSLFPYRNSKTSARLKDGLPPQLLKPRRVGGGVANGVLIFLNEPRVGSLVGEGAAASVAKYVGMGQEGHSGCLAARIEKEIDGRAVQRLRCSVTKNVLPVGFIRARCLSHPQMVLTLSPRKGCVVEQTILRDVQQAALSVHLVELQAASFGNAQGGTSKATGNGRGPRCRCHWSRRSACQHRVRSGGFRSLPRPVFLGFRFSVTNYHLHRRLQKNSARTNQPRLYSSEKVLFSRARPAEVGPYRRFFQAPCRSVQNKPQYSFLPRC
jgi:hypothetical protein